MRFYTLIFILVCMACSQYSTKRSSKKWHDFNAKYNAYLQAKDNLKVAEASILAQYKDNYSELLPILIPLDSNTSKVASKELEAILKKGSLIADKHQNSKFLGDAYNLIAKARLYKGDYINAIETYKYVNSEATEWYQKHEALVMLMRAYMENNDTPTALRVGEILAEQDLNKANSLNFYLNKAHIHQQQGEYKLSVQIVEQALPLMKKGPQKARLHFVAGQLYNLLDDVRNSSVHYKAVHKNNPNYDLAFYSELNKSMYSTGSDMIANFEKLVKDRKNVDLLDKLYYSMALLYEKAGNVNEAMASLSKATKAQSQGTQNKASAYLKMGDISYFRLQKYNDAKAYYDSALVLMPSTSAGFEDIANRKRALDEYAAEQNIIKTEDSLQHMAAMDSLSLEAYLDKAIKEKLEYEKKAVDAAKKLNQAQAKAAQIAAGNVTGGDPTKRWYFYNENALMTGRIEFMQRWGQRKLEDHWRRQVKDLVSFEPVAATQPMADSTKADAEVDVSRIDELKTAIKVKLPKNAQDLKASKNRQAVAYFNVGKIYRLFLLENEKAKQAFHKHLDINPNLDQAPEAMYYLALIDEGTAQADYWKKELNARYPTSFFTRKLNRGKENLSKGDEDKAAVAYNTAYKLYDANDLERAMQMSDEALKLYPGSNFEDKLAFLKILIFSKTREKEKYALALDEFLLSHNKSTLMPLAKEMRDTLAKTDSNK